jgi:phosphatidylethanolamine/phosphatidyl-N-methylethanolamine N-methyltransferase
MALDLLKQFFRNPHQIGAVATSTQSLGRMMLGETCIDSADVIAEYGPGSGPFTRQILARKKSDATFFAIEQNPKMVECLRQKYPAVDCIEGSAADVGHHARERGRDNVDLVVSGLPWAAFPEDLQDTLLTATLDALRPGGEFVTFAYLCGLMTKAGKRFRKKLDEHFSVVEKSPTVWWNFPAAFVYRCKK